MNSFRLPIVCLLFMATVGWAEESVTTENLPDRVKEYTSRVYQCLQWGREVESSRFDPERAAHVKRAIEALDCQHLPLEAAYLQRTYATHSEAAREVEVATLDWKNAQRQPE